jgi:hypothetical protein
MNNKLNDKDLALIMAYVDGELAPSQNTSFEKLIASNPDAKAAFEDLKLSSTVYKGYVSSIQDNAENIRYEIPLKKEKTNYFQIIFQKPIRNFVAYPVAAAFIFTLGFQMNSNYFIDLIRSPDENTSQYRGIETKDEAEKKVEELEKEIEGYKEEIATLSKLLSEQMYTEQPKPELSSFDKAFISARESRQKEFTWEGKKYTTDIKD